MNNGIAPKTKVHTTDKPEPSGRTSINHTARQSARRFALDQLDDEELGHFVRVVAGHRDAVCFSLTSDGGALSVTVLQGTLRHKAYAATPEELLTAFTNLLAELY